MNTAGIDCGTTLVKAVHGRSRAELTAARGSDVELRMLCRRLVESDVRAARLTGTGWREVAAVLERAGIEAVPPVEGIDDEIVLQARGAKRLLADHGERPPKRAIVASVGTGVSYAKMSGNAVKRSPLGSCHGGGTIMGLARLLGIDDFKSLTELARRGRSPDLLVRDAVPSASGTRTGDLVISHFARPDASLEDNCAGIFSLAATSVVKDLAVLLSIPFSPKHVILVGSVAQSPVFLAHLARHWPHLPKSPELHVPKDGRFAAATGAFMAITDR